MMKMRKTMKLVWAVLLMFGLMVTVVACGNNTAEQENGAAEETVYKVGTEPTFQPFEYKDLETDEIVGFDIDLIKAIAEEGGFKVEIQSLGFDALIPAVQSGTIDIVASGMTIDEERSKQVDFTQPYINAGLALAVAKSNETIKSEEDLEGATVAVQIGTTGAMKANELKEQGIVEKVLTYDTIDVLMAELTKGTVDAVINDAAVTESFIKSGHDDIKIVGEQMNTEQYGFAVAKGNTELLQRLNDGLQKVMASGKYEQLLAKYDLPANARP
ncbi:MAG TPA: basic amino acid ABC transporter substrate-binding protein [Peptococcaceae bacterium]|nr:basic amino acid ABC transporter substrate-binding protein [Peptococcaceae bacterium]HPZ71448.1 basic amino acid ABC transporter substrate-binding protein [Peptococcaceae bacterium]HQD54174.1 basic amino acid ABC transporter substrate-binding protein [Peptococcaceae bacterium]